MPFLLNPIMDIPDDMLGLGPDAFIAMKKNSSKERISSYNVKWQGSNIQIPVFLVDIKHLRYNLWNTRVKPHLTQYISKEGQSDNYFSTVDRDSFNIQKLINNFLKKNPDRIEALRFFKKPLNIPEIQEPLVATPDGRVLNGNQRLCVFRQLFHEDSSKYGHLQMAYVAILPSKGTLQQERDLEATFQDTKLAAIMFDWIQQGLWLKDERAKGKNAAQIGKIIGKSENEVNGLLRRITLGEEFLEHIGKQGFWVELRDTMQLTQAFKTLDEQQGKMKTLPEKISLKKGAFKMMEDPDGASKGKSTSVHLLIIKLAKSILAGGISIGVKPSKAIKQKSKSLLKPLKPKTEPKNKSKEINLEDLDADKFANLVIDDDDVRESKRKANNNKNYALSQTKSMITTLENIYDGIDNMNKKGLKTNLNKANRLIEQIRNLI
jgi:hypothetical protein